MCKINRNILLSFNVFIFIKRDDSASRQECRFTTFNKNITTEIFFVSTLADHDNSLWLDFPSRLTPFMRAQSIDDDASNISGFEKLLYWQSSMRCRSPTFTIYVSSDALKISYFVISLVEHKYDAMTGSER